MKSRPLLWIVVAGLVAWPLGWRLTRGEVFSATTLARLKPGMTTNEVVAILGPPSSVLSGRWVYSRALMFNVGLVNFDGLGHLTYAVNE